MAVVIVMYVWCLANLVRVIIMDSSWWVILLWGACVAIWIVCAHFEKLSKRHDAEIKEMIESNKKANEIMLKRIRLQRLENAALRKVLGVDESDESKIDVRRLH